MTLTTNTQHALNTTRYVLPLAILLTAFFFRFHRLNEVPPGMTHDEASIGFFVKQIANRTGFVIDAPYGYANEPFTKYSASLLMYGIGQTEWALRAHQALWGVLLVVMTLKWGSVAFNHNVGVAASALVAVSFWATMTSRFALNSNPAPALFTGAMWLLWVALFKEKVKRRGLAWTGFALLLAASLLTYEASRGAWLALPTFAVYLFAINRRERLPQFLISMSLGTSLALPHLLNPAAWGRTGTLSVALGEAAKGNVTPLLTNVSEAFGTLFIKGDPFVVYNIPNRPVLDWVSGLLFVCGVLVCLWRWKNPSNVFAVLWLGAGFAPAAAVGAFTMMLHAITVQAVVMVLVALGAQAAITLSASLRGALPIMAAQSGVLASGLRRSLQGLRRQASLYVGADLSAATGWLAFALFVIFIAFTNFNDYFYKWADAKDTRAAYFANFRGVTDFLRKTDRTGSLTLSSPFPNLPHDPFVVDMRLFRDDLDLRWFDAREALMFPQTEKSLLVLPNNAPLDPFFASYLPMSEKKRYVVRADDVDPYFDVVLWNPQATLANLLNDKSVIKVDTPADFSGAVELLAYSVSASTVKGGDTVKVITIWRIIDPARLGERALVNYSIEANLFLHLVDASGNWVAGDDRLHAPAWNWRRGDAFAQIHRVSIPKDAQGEFRLLTGIYTLPDLTRILLTDGDTDSVPITIIKVTH